MQYRGDSSQPSDGDQPGTSVQEPTAAVQPPSPFVNQSHQPVSIHEPAASVQPQSSSANHPPSPVLWKEHYNPAATWKPSTARNSTAAPVEAEERSRFLNLESIQKDRRQFQVDKERREREAILRQEEVERLERVEFENRKRNEDHRKWIEDNTREKLRQSLLLIEIQKERKKKTEELKTEVKEKEIERRQKERRLRHEEKKREEDRAAKKKDYAVSRAALKERNKKERLKEKIPDLFGSDSDQECPAKRQNEPKSFNGQVRLHLKQLLKPLDRPLSPADADSIEKTLVGTPEEDDDVLQLHL